MYIEADRQTDKQKDRQIDRQTDRQKERVIYILYIESEREESRQCSQAGAAADIYE